MVSVHRHDPQHYDAIVIGAGQAGAPLSRALASAGWRTILIERLHVGGTCINEGCTPSKTMIASARVAYLARRADDYGLRAGPITVDMHAVRKRKQDMVDSWRSSGERRLRAAEGLELVEGEARFVSPNTVEIRSADGSSRLVEAPHVFINTGCRPAVPELPGLAGIPYLTSTTTMELGTLPEHLLILGGGYVAVEFAQMFRRFGSKVTIVHRHDDLLPREDADIGQALGTILEEDGVLVIPQAQARSVRTTGEAGSGRGAGRASEAGIELDLTTPTGSRTLTGSHLLVATGRVPNTEALAPEAAGLELDRKGYVVVNGRLQTRVPGIFALGDVNGGPAFTHIAYDDFRIVRANLLEGGSRTTADRLVPNVVFTDPQLGRVGLSERQARERDIEVKVFKMPAKHIARALETGEARGMMKVLVDVTTDRILGCAILTVDGGEIMSALQLAMVGGLTVSSIKDTVFAHPTLAESLNNLFDQ